MGRWGRSSSIARCGIVEDGNGGRISEAEELKEKTMQVWCFGALLFFSFLFWRFGGFLGKRGVEFFFWVVRVAGSGDL